MKFLRHLSKSRKVRTSTTASIPVAATSLEGSATIPLKSTGLVFVDNSQGASAAVGEFARLVDGCELGLGGGEGDEDEAGEMNDQVQFKLKKLYDEAGKYDNCRVDEEESETWKCDRSEAEVVEAAWACSAGVYKEGFKPKASTFASHSHLEIPASVGGTIKATNISIVREDNPLSELHHEYLPMVVVAIRGTASYVDGMVNMCGEPKKMTAFKTKQNPEGRLIQAHSGFLNCTEALLPAVKKSVEDVLRRNQEIKHILFTGHSAGGAVASLMFLKLGSELPFSDPKFRISCIAFGAPPVITDTVPSYFSNIAEVANTPMVDDEKECSVKSEKKGLLLSIVNEYDLVTRADGAYLRSLVDLYRSMYGLPPIQEESVSRTEEDTPLVILPRFSFEAMEVIKMSQKAKNLWPLPKVVYCHVGEIIVLRVRVEKGTEEGADQDLLSLKALKVKGSDFAKLLFVNVNVHRRMAYTERIGMLADFVESATRVNKGGGKE